jgi:putative addiction module CopG family antidote
MSRTTSLTVTLPDDLDAFIRERVAAGRFPSAGALIRQAVEDLERRERERDAVIADLNREIETGARQAETGQLRDGKQVLADIRRRRAGRHGG